MIFRLCDLDEYAIPPDSNIEAYQDYINSLPPYDDPMVFGQHANADIKALINEAKLLCETLMTVQGSQKGLSTNVEEEVICANATKRFFILISFSMVGFIINIILICLKMTFIYKVLLKKSRMALRGSGMSIQT